MYTPSLFSLALLASSVTAQMSLSQVLAANNATLSTLSSKSSYVCFTLLN